MPKLVAAGSSKNKTGYLKTLKGRFLKDKALKEKIKKMCEVKGWDFKEAGK